MDRSELASWLRLLSTPGVGRALVRRLLATFGAPEAVISASGTALAQAGGATAALLQAPPEGFEQRLDLTQRWLDGSQARDIVTLGDPRYPENLLQTADPPLLLYVQGRADLLRTPQIAIVGSRNPTAQGADNARAFARHLAREGWTITSGMALGIDGAAHEGALDAGGTTIAAVGTGLDIVYPKRHLSLAHRIAEAGLIISEFPLGTPSMSQNFPQRNRLIAGLGRGTLVVEAALQSGSLITARLAVEAGRDVFAIPGSIHSPQSRGCHALIKQGAKLVETAQDIADELGLVCERSRAETPEPDGQPPDRPEATDGDALLAALGHDPVSLDALEARTGWPAALLSGRLLELELEGRVARLPGQLFQRRSTG